MKARRTLAHVSPRPFRYASVPRSCPGGTVVCIASGPSLTTDDVEYVRGKVDAVIVVNNCYQIAPWADILCASDLRWWRWHNGAKAFPGVKYATSHHCSRWAGVQVLENTGRDGLELNPSGVRHGLNTGYRAINVAVHLGATRILLLGYDMQQGPNKEEHWHGEHPSNSRSPYALFRKSFKTMVEPLKALGVEVINCSRRTALDVFPQMSIDAALPIVGQSESPIEMVG